MKKGDIVKSGRLVPEATPNPDAKERARGFDFTTIHRRVKGEVTFVNEAGTHMHVKGVRMVQLTADFEVVTAAPVAKRIAMCFAAQSL